MATAPEAEAINAVKDRLYARPPPPAGPNGHGGLAPEGLLDVQLLRFVREHGLDVRTIERLFRKALDWRRKSLPLMTEQVAAADEDRWLGAIQMPHGEWATQYVRIGLFCGYSRRGNPVKIERLGAYDVPGLRRHPNGTRQLNAFYLGLVDFLQRRLDALSLANNRLQQTYEIFDLEGLGPHMISFTVLQFTKDVLLAFATHYPSSFHKAVVINAPSFLPPVWRMVSAVLPESVRAKVKIFGGDWRDELQRDLSDEAFRWVGAPHEALIRAPHEADDGDDDGAEWHECGEHAPAAASA